MMNKAITIVLVASVALLVALLCGGAEVPGPVEPQSPAPVPATRPTILGLTLADLQFKSVPLEAAIEELRDRTHANIVVEWKQLEAAGVEPTAPVRVRLWDVTLDKALRIVLDDVDQNLGFQEQGGIITISTRERLASKTVIQIYDIRPLVDAMAGRVAPNETMTHADIIDSVIKLIEDIIDPDTWKDNGGSVGSIYAVPGLLVVQQTPSVQRKVQDLLEDIEGGQGAHVVQLRPSTTRPAR